MSAISKKIAKKAGEEVTPLDQEVATALLDIEIGSKELAADLRELSIASTKEVDVAGAKKAIIVVLPFRQAKKFQKNQARVSRELEKKLGGRQVVFVAQRTILGTQYRRQTQGKQNRPRSRTLTAVHEAILEDVVYPTQIVGKRTRVRVDGSKLLRVFLDAKDSTESTRLATYAAVYKKLTNKNVSFEIPVSE